MANQEQLAQLMEGVEAWNRLRLSDVNMAVDLSASDLSGKDLRGADLHGADFSSANLRAANLQGAWFKDTNLSEASLREANLRGVDLNVVKRGLQTEQLAGADLTGAALPAELEKVYDGLQNVNNISESARKLFLAVLGASLYSWLTIATTTDVNLITNRASSPLPIIQASIPIVGFYWVAPLLLLCVYFYFHFYLQKLWEELGSLPAILPDGRPLHAKIDPWLLNDLVRAHLPKLSANRPFLSHFQLWISVLLAWWAVPLTMFLFWGRYLPRQDRTGTTYHVVLLVISLAAALCLYRLAVATLQGRERKPFRWRGILTSRRGYQTTAFAIAAGGLFAVVSWGARWGVPSDQPVLGVPLQVHWQDDYQQVIGATGYLTWVPRLMALVDYSPFADFRGAEVSQKKPTWSKNGNDPDSVIGARLNRSSLRYASASRAFLAGADLDESDLRNADLSSASLRGAHLTFTHMEAADLSHANLNGAVLFGTHLEGAYLYDAHLVGARLQNATLSGADLSSADLDAAEVRANLTKAKLNDANLTYADFRKARNVDPESVKCALHWDRAFYADDTLKALGLPPEHNGKLAEQQKKEEDLQHKQNAEQTAPNATPPKE